MFAITSFFAAIAALMLVALSVNVIRTRRRELVLIGDGGNEAMQRAMRAQANFAEYTPMMLILLALLESSTTASWLLVTLASVFLVGRLSHAYSLISYETAHASDNIGSRVRYRKYGMMATFTVLVTQALLLIVA